MQSEKETASVSGFDESFDPEAAKNEDFTAANLVLSEIDYYELSNSPDYKQRNRILLGGIVPFIPIRSTISASDPDPGLVQKSVSVLVYFKQNFYPIFVFRNYYLYSTLSFVKLI